MSSTDTTSSGIYVPPYNQNDTQTAYATLLRIRLVLRAKPGFPN